MKDHDNRRHPGITMHKIPVAAGFAGALFTVGSMLIFLFGIPLLRYFFMGALAVGIGVAVLLHFTDRAR